MGQETSFVEHYLSYFRQQLITHLLLAIYFPRLCVLKVHVKISYLPLPSSPVCSEHPTLFCMSFSVPCLLLLFFFCGAGVSLSRGLCWFIPEVTVGIPCAVYLLTCWFSFPKQAWSQCLAVWEPSCFLSVMCHGEALYGLGVWGVRVLLLLGVFFFCQVWLQHLSKIFDLWSSHCLLSPSSYHLGSSPNGCWVLLIL
jgi:hypothetical protein